MSTASATRVILVTGSNRGIGYGIVARLAREFLPTKGKEERLKIFMGSRDQQKGEDAIKSLQNELGKTLQSNNTSLQACQLDMNDVQSRKNAIAYIVERDGGLDTVINNAGIAMDGFNEDVVKKTFQTNFHDVIAFNNELLPILQQNARIVILASMAGSLQGYSDEIIRRFRAVSTVKEAESLADEYLKAVQKGDHKEKGWKEAAYSCSKACIIAYTRAFSNELRKSEDERLRSITVNCCCPGYVNTGMTKGKGVLSLDQGAATPVMLALQDLNGRSGGYFKDEKEQKW